MDLFDGWDLANYGVILTNFLESEGVAKSRRSIELGLIGEEKKD